MAFKPCAGCEQRRRQLKYMAKQLKQHFRKKARDRESQSSNEKPHKPKGT